MDPKTTKLKHLHEVIVNGRHAHLIRVFRDRSAGPTWPLTGKLMAEVWYVGTCHHRQIELVGEGRGKLVDTKKFPIILPLADVTERVL